MRLLTLRSLPFIILLLIIIPASAAVPSWEMAVSPGSEFTSVAISADGSTVVAGGDQLVVMTANGNKIWAGWSGAALDVSGDGRYIATSQGPSVRLFDRNGLRLWDQALGPTIRSVSISPDGLIVAAGGGSTIQSWHNSGSGIGLNGTDTVRNLRISPASDQVIVATSSALRAFNLSMVPRWTDDQVSPGLIGISRDGTRIVVQYGNHVRMYHGGGTLLWDRQVTGGNIIALAFSRDGSTIAIGRDDNTVVLLDREGTVLWTATLSSFVGGLAVSDNGSVIAAGTLDNNLNVYDRKGALLGTSRTKGPIKAGCVAVSGDGSLIVATDQTKVYGFETARIISPAPTPAPVNSPGPAGELPHAPVTPETTLPATLPASLPVTPQATPPAPAAGYPLFLSLAAMAIVLLFRRIS
jgi:WD40 repeat protein